METLKELSEINELSPIADVMDARAKALIDQYQSATTVNWMGKTISKAARNALYVAAPAALVGAALSALNQSSSPGPAILFGCIALYFGTGSARNEATQEYNAGVRAKVPALAEETAHVQRLVSDILECTNTAQAGKTTSKEELRERIQSVKDNSLAILEADYRKAGFGRWEAKDLIRPLDQACDMALQLLQVVQLPKVQALPPIQAAAAA